MCTKEKRALRAIEKLREEQTAASQKISKIRARFKEGCTHSHIEPFEWEHDNGYGRQSQCVGHRCVLCHKKNYYPSISNQWSGE